MWKFDKSSSNSIVQWADDDVVRPHQFVVREILSELIPYECHKFNRGIANKWRIRSFESACIQQFAVEDCMPYDRTAVLWRRVSRMIVLSVGRTAYEQVWIRRFDCSHLTRPDMNQKRVAGVNVAVQRERY